MASRELRAVAHRLKEGVAGHAPLTKRIVAQAISDIERIAEELDEMDAAAPPDVMRLARKLRRQGVRIAGEQYREAVRAE